MSQRGSRSQKRGRHGSPGTGRSSSRSGTRSPWSGSPGGSSAGDLTVPQLPRTRSGRDFHCPADSVFLTPPDRLPELDDEGGPPPLLDLAIFGEITKFLWILTPSVRLEKKANYILLQEFLDVCMALMRVTQTDFSEKRADQDSRALFKLVMPGYVTVTKKMDFLSFNEAIYALAQDSLPMASVGARAAWLSKVANRITRPSTPEERQEADLPPDEAVVGEFADPVWQGEGERLNVFTRVDRFVHKHRDTEESVFEECKEVWSLYDPCAYKHAICFFLLQHPAVQCDPSFNSPCEAGIFGTEFVPVTKTAVLDRVEVFNQAEHPEDPSPSEFLNDDPVPAPVNPPAMPQAPPPLPRPAAPPPPLEPEPEPAVVDDNYEGKVPSAASTRPAWHRTPLRKPRVKGLTSSWWVDYTGRIHIDHTKIDDAEQHQRPQTAPLWRKGSMGSATESTERARSSGRTGAPLYKSDRLQDLLDAKFGWTEGSDPVTAHQNYVLMMQQGAAGPAGGAGYAGAGAVNAGSGAGTGYAGGAGPGGGAGPAGGAGYAGAGAGYAGSGAEYAGAGAGPAQRRPATAMAKLGGGAGLALAPQRRTQHKRSDEAKRGGAAQARRGGAEQAQLPPKEPQRRSYSACLARGELPSRHQRPGSSLSNSGGRTRSRAAITRPGTAAGNYYAPTGRSSPGLSPGPERTRAQIPAERRARGAADVVCSLTPARVVFSGHMDDLSQAQQAIATSSPPASGTQSPVQERPHSRGSAPHAKGLADQKRALSGDGMRAASLELQKRRASSALDNHGLHKHLTYVKLSDSATELGGMQLRGIKTVMGGVQIWSTAQRTPWILDGEYQAPMAEQGRQRRLWMMEKRSYQETENRVLRSTAPSYSVPKGHGHAAGAGAHSSSLAGARGNPKQRAARRGEAGSKDVQRGSERGSAPLERAAPSEGPGSPDVPVPKQGHATAKHTKAPVSTPSPKTRKSGADKILSILSPAHSASPQPIASARSRRRSSRSGSFTVMTPAALREDSDEISPRPWVGGSPPNRRHHGVISERSVEHSVEADEREFHF